jgi:[ribosomal protein S5]-alanine N-acetyltransferase
MHNGATAMYHAPVTRPGHVATAWPDPSNRMSAVATPYVPEDWRDGLPTLVAPGLTLREPVLADASSLFTHLTTEDVARFISRPPGRPTGFEQFVSWAQSERQAGRCMVYGIVPERQAHAVGLIQIRQIEAGFTGAEWGFALGQPFWGTGLFMRAASVVVDFAFRYAGAHRLEARSAIQNGRGNGVLQKIGASPEGVLRQSFIRSENECFDQVLWSLLHDDWLTVHVDPDYTCHPPQVREPEKFALGSRPDSAVDLPQWRRALPTLRSPRLALREPRLEDAASLLAMISTREVGSYILPPPDSIRGYEQFILWSQAKREAGQFLCFVVVPHDDSRAVGMFQLRQLEPGFLSAEWGFALGRPFWGTGIFPESANLVLEFAFDTLGVRRLEARAAVENGRSHGALRKMGAVQEGRLRRSFLLGGQYMDDALWSILAEDWRARRTGTTAAP